MLIEKDLKENWQFLKAEVLKRWSRLAEADVENAHGNLQALKTLVLREYGNAGSFMDEIQKIYDQLKTSSSIVKNTKPINAGQRDNAPERKLNENFSRINSPDEIKNGLSESPTIYENEHSGH